MITAIILAKNEEGNLKTAIKSLDWCDEILVADDNSEDRSVIVARNLGATVISVPQNLNFSEKRNFAIKEVKNEWVLFLDADEVIPQNLKDEIVINLKDGAYAYDGFSIKRIDIIWGGKMRFGDTKAATFIRLARRNKGIWKGAVHEVWDIKKNIKQLNNPIHHYPHPNIVTFVKEINLYSSLRAKELRQNGVQVTMMSITLYPLGKFVYVFIIKLGILDGISGLVSAIIMSFYSYLVRGKLWELWQKSKNSSE